MKQNTSNNDEHKLEDVNDIMIVCNSLLTCLIHDKENLQKQSFEKGYAKCRADVEKIIDDKCDDINSSLSIEFFKDERDINEKNARFEELKRLKQETAKLEKMK